MTRPYPDPDQVDRDELAERRRERDRHREPARWRRPPRDLTARRELAIRHGTDSIPVPCPACNATCFAPADSDRERIDCVECEGRLVTRLGIGGELELVVAEPGGAT